MNLADEEDGAFEITSLINILTFTPLLCCVV